MSIMETIIYITKKMGSLIFLLLNALLLIIAFKGNGQVGGYIAGGLWIIHSGMFMYQDEITEWIVNRKKNKE